MRKSDKRIAKGIINRMKTLENNTIDFRSYGEMMKIKPARIAMIAGVLEDMGLVRKLEGFRSTSIQLTESGIYFKSFWFYDLWQSHGPYSKILFGTIPLILVALVLLLIKCRSGSQ